jgi:hypothetical protein
MNTANIWAIAQFNHTTKRWNVLTGEEGAKYGSLCPESFDTIEHAQKAAQQIATICNLAFEYPTDEHGNIEFI